MVFILLLIFVFDADIFEEKVQGYDELIQEIQKSDIAAVTNPGFELFLILHEEDSFEKYISGHESEFLSKDENGGYHHAYDVLRDITGMNAKKNSNIGDLAEKVLYAISQEKKINQNIHNCKGVVTSNVGWGFVNEICPPGEYYRLFNQRLKYIYVDDCNINFVYNNRLYQYDLNTGDFKKNVAGRNMRFRRFGGEDVLPEIG